MRMNMVLAGAVAATMPIAVDAPDSSLHSSATAGETRIRIAAGTGTYSFVSRGCNGEVISQLPVRYGDVGAAIDHRFEGSPLSVGVRGGVLRDAFGEWSNPRPGSPSTRQTVTNRYVNPHIGIDGGHGAVDLGWVAHERPFITAGEIARTQPDHPMNDFSASVRFGDLKDRYFAIRWMESVPLYSEGGYLTIGVGGTPHPNLGLQLGISAGGPFEGAGLYVRGSRMFDSGIGVTAAGRTGLAEPAAYGGTLGIEYRIANHRARIE